MRTSERASLPIQRANERASEFAQSGVRNRASEFAQFSEFERVCTVKGGRSERVSLRSPACGRASERALFQVSIIIVRRLFCSYDFSYIRIYRAMRAIRAYISHTVRSELSWSIIRARRASESERSRVERASEGGSGRASAASERASVRASELRASVCLSPERASERASAFQRAREGVPFERASERANERAEVRASERASEREPFERASVAF